MKRWLAYAQLVRLPNVFTAFADIGLGVLASGGGSGLWWVAAGLLFLASGCLYSGGMVWNDYFDLDQDRRERPFRPLPSGRVTRKAAFWLGTGLLASGLLATSAFGVIDAPKGWAPLVLAACLAVAILLYDGWLKRTWAGPLAMGTCRFLNVLLGWSLAAAAGWPWAVGFHLALVVGLYIIGVTWFARTEARTSRKALLAGAAGFLLLALLVAVPVPTGAAGAVPWQATSPLFIYLLVGLGFLVGWPVRRALARPAPERVQAAVKRAILGLVVLDAVLATALVGGVGLVLLILLLPALYLGRWLYST
jgi:4-hydroxybenzoate polyprenyltransferase